MPSSPIATRVCVPLQRSLEHRARISAVLKPLRRTLPRVPFYELPAHTIPTRWNLYRGLLRAAHDKQIRWRIQSLFHHNQHLTSPQRTKEMLQSGHKFLEALVRSNNGDIHQQKVLARYSTLIATKRAKVLQENRMVEELGWQKQLKNRPILTGGYLRPSYANPPLPRMKPQPQHVSMMIRRRLGARSRRMQTHAMLKEFRDDLGRETGFEERLAKKHPEVKNVYRHLTWRLPIEAQMDRIQQSFSLENARVQMKYTPEMLEMIKEARRRKIENKTRERERERRGEVLTRTRKKMAKGLPAHVLSFRGQKGVDSDKAVKDPSLGGYTGMMKRKAGMKIGETHGGEDSIVPNQGVYEVRKQIRKRGRL